MVILMSNNNYTEYMNRRNEIMKKSVGLDYQKYEQKGIGFDYELMMNDQGYNLEKIIKVQTENMVGKTPLVELKNITRYARKYAQSGKGARIFLKDEAANLSGSFKARRAALAVNTAKELGYKGVIAATSGNYGAAVAALAAKKGLNVSSFKSVLIPRIIANQRY